jgi:hypothetical protein
MDRHSSEISSRLLAESIFALCFVSTGIRLDRDVSHTASTQAYYSF